MDPSKLITSMVPFVIQQLADPAIKELAKIWNVDKELAELLATYYRIEGMLDIWKSRWELNNVSFKTWLQDLDGYLYDTEDLVDDLLLNRTTNGENENLGKNPLRFQILTSFSIKPLTTPHKIIELRENLERVSKLWNSGQNISKQLNSEASSSDPHYISRLSDEMPFISGTIRDQDKQTIIENLIKCDRSGVSIVGIDGLGKTALARTIMVDETIKSRYPLILSVSVTGDFHMTDIVHKLVASYLETSPQAAEIHGGGDGGKLLQDRLCKERALIILDNLCSVRDEDWQRFECSYLNICPGGKILITTPNPKVAEVTKSIAHDLVIMTDQDCIKLIMETGNLSKHECETFASEIKAIAKKCQGLPIIANKVGLELSKITKMDEKKDRICSLQEYDLWDLPEFRKVFLSLNLNELKLPLHLKRCFAYCSLFPLDHKFNKDELIQLWEAEGFIPPQERISSKAVARKECFDNMLSRSILHPSESSDNEQPIYKMLEYRHRFAQLLAPQAFCRVDEEGTSKSISSCQNIRHLSLNNCQNIDETLLKKIKRCKGLRTFLLLNQNNHRPLSIPSNFFEKLQSLRLLDLSLTSISTLSNPASLSKHLRYLDVSGTCVNKLPKQIQYLRALQVLKLKNCSKLLQLPKELIQLISLTHLHFSVKKLVCPLSNMGKLTNLEVLDSFFVGKVEGCKVLELGNMKNLTELHMFGLDVIGGMAEAREAKLTEKPWLKKLVLEWNNAKAENAEKVLEGLQPHNNLNVLKVSNYGGRLFPVWLMSPGCHLVSIYLDNCPSCEVLPTLGQLPILKNLVLRSIHKVTSLDDRFCGEGERVFPNLELLEFQDMKNLANWTGLKDGDMPKLRALKIVGCPVLFSLPSFTHLGCLMILEINNCPKLQLLPELPSSLHDKSGKLIITYSPLVKERCQDGKADWPKIKGIPYVEIHTTKVHTGSSIQHRTNDKDQVSRNEQAPTFAKLMKENNVSQKSEQDTAPLQNLEKERQMDKMSKKEHDSATHPHTAYESCTSQHEEPGSKQPAACTS